MRGPLNSVGRQQHPFLADGRGWIGGFAEDRSVAQCYRSSGADAIGDREVYPQYSFVYQIAAGHFCAFNGRDFEIGMRIVVGDDMSFDFCAGLFFSSDRMSAFGEFKVWNRSASAEGFSNAQLSFDQY